MTSVAQYFISVIFSKYYMLEIFDCHILTSRGFFLLANARTQAKEGSSNNSEVQSCARWSITLLFAP